MARKNRAKEFGEISVFKALVMDLICKVINSMFILLVVLSIIAIPFCTSLIEMMDDEKVKRTLHVLKYPFGAIVFIVIFTRYLLKELDSLKKDL